MKHSKVVGTLLILFGGLVATSPSARPADPQGPLDQARMLLQLSYSASSQMRAEDRTFYLVKLVRWSKGVLPDSEIRQRCQEMFQLAFEIPDGWDRVAQEKNALVFLSNVSDADAVLAMRLFDKVEDPQPDTDGTFPEDVRSYGAATIFRNYWNSGKDIPTKLILLGDIRREAQRLGVTGEYPYAAMADMVVELGKVRSDEATKQANEIFAEALGFFRRGSAKFLNRNRVFLAFLQKIKKAQAIPDTSLFGQALQIFTRKLMQTPKDMDFRGEFKNNSTGAVIMVTDDRVASLVEAIPMIREFSPELAAHLTREYPELSKAGNDMTYLSGGFVSPEISESQVALWHSRLLQRSLVREIAKIQDSDPQGAKALAARLSDDGSRIEGYAALIPGLMKTDPEEATRIYQSESPRLQEVMDRVDHLRARVAMVKASHHIHDSQSFVGQAMAALDEGTMLFEADSRQRPQLHPYLRKGYDQLIDLAEFGGLHGSDRLISGIQQLQNVDLKVDLLVYAAKGLKDSAALSR